MDSIIENTVKKPKQILEWSFTAKRELLYAIGAINESICHNLTQLNTIRNHFAHNNNKDFSKVKDMVFKFIQEDETYKEENLRKYTSIDTILTEILTATYLEIFVLNGVE